MRHPVVKGDQVGLEAAKLLGELARQGSAHHAVSALTEEITQAPWEYHFLLDTSSSMNGGKIEEMRVGAQEAVNSLATEAMVSIITFASEARLRVASSVDRPMISQVVKSLEAEGSTALSEALLASESRLEGKRAIIHVVTDGYPDDPEGALRVGERLKRAGHVIRCIGVTGANEEFLAKLAGGEQKKVSGVFVQSDFRRAIVAAAVLPPPTKSLPGRGF